MSYHLMGEREGKIKFLPIHQEQRKFYALFNANVILSIYFSFFAETLECEYEGLLRSMPQEREGKEKERVMY